MERAAEQAWNSYTYQVSQHSADMLKKLNGQRKNGGRFCDVVLRVGDESFPAHKAVLAACSDYFESVFGSAMDEAAGRELEMHTISAKVFRDILDFAYTSRIVVRLESFPELMTAAKFLLMRSVIEICQEVIKQSNVQIMVPPARGDMMLFRPANVDFGFTLDLATAAAATCANGNFVAENGHLPSASEIKVGSPGAPAATLPSLQGSLPAMDGLVTSPTVPTLVAGQFQAPVNSVGADHAKVVKRGRGRPRKSSLLDLPLLTAPLAMRDEGFYPCSFCGKVFKNANRLLLHEAQHTGLNMELGSGENQIPGLGDGLLASSSGLDLPRKRGRMRKNVACELCGKAFRDVYHLNRHKLSHSGEKPFECPICHQRFKRKDRMTYHIRSHDGAVGKPYICISCGKGFSRPDHLNGHIKQVHTAERPFKCQTCEASFATKDRLRSHLTCHEEKVPCQVCGKYLRAAYMTDHVKKHNEGPNNICNICNKGFSTASYLRVHIKTHHGVPLPNSHTSDPCDRRCKPQPQIMIHKQTQSGEMAFHFDRTRSLQDGEMDGLKCQHQDSQDNSDSFGDLSDISDLKSPLKHDQDESFQCDINNGKVKIEANAEQYTEPKKYTCPDCGSVFKSKSYLNKHMLKVHVKPTGGVLADLPTGLSSPFSPQQNMSLLESFGFQIVQNAFGSTLADPDPDPGPEPEQNTEDPAEQK
ncbi:POZ-, AT hook-, and zinc finger-containing protein 1 isoform X1 [Carcharodon carcharias]|uniref:POZ-, AT hook-, and zinc finger-containing protein 1 isoform X1 n=1 Tax=Carcharodon carcharias TaxID=13397 RepID=UPI001B7F11E0|nr:POZ-, AT hook-, and zinc finger-containing protein 1 isoform X1 [Carcharodon carcharias]